MFDFGRVVQTSFMTAHFRSHYQNEEKPEMGAWHLDRKWNACAHGGRIRINCGMRTRQRGQKVNEDGVTYTV